MARLMLLNHENERSLRSIRPRDSFRFRSDLEVAFGSIFCQRHPSRYCNFDSTLRECGKHKMHWRHLKSSVYAGTIAQAEFASEYVPARRQERDPEKWKCPANPSADR